MIFETSAAPRERERMRYRDDKIRESPSDRVYLHPTPTDRYRFTREAVDLMENAGQLKGRYELLDGELIQKMGQNSPHSISVMRAVLYLAGTQIFPQDCIRTQATMEVRLDDQVSNRPEPDVMALREPTRRGAPSGDNVLLLIEISDTTQLDDYGAKVELYARAGVLEYWILDVKERRLKVFRESSGNDWSMTIDLGEDDTIAPLSATEHAIRVGDLLPLADDEE